MGYQRSNWYGKYYQAVFYRSFGRYWCWDDEGKTGLTKVQKGCLLSSKRTKEVVKELKNREDVDRVDIGHINLTAAVVGY